MTFPALAKRMAFCTPEQAIDVAKAVVIVQRDNGNREDRKTARMKYLIANWGIERFRKEVESVLGFQLNDCAIDDVRGVDDHMGWQPQKDGRWSYGLCIENGRIRNADAIDMKTALREIAQRLNREVRLAGNQSLIFCDVETDEREQVLEIIERHGIRSSENTSLVRRFAMACVALPSCGLAITEGERRLPGVIDELEMVLAKLGLSSERFTIRMTGCPNGCARPYTADVALVGKAVDRYTLFLGGRLLGNRLAEVYRDTVPADEIVFELTRVFAVYKQKRSVGEGFGDFCNRIGLKTLIELCESAAVEEVINK